MVAGVTGCGGGGQGLADGGDRPDVPDVGVADRGVGSGGASGAGSGGSGAGTGGGAAGDSGGAGGGDGDAGGDRADAGGDGSAPLTEDQFCAEKSDGECQVSAACGLPKDGCRAQRKARCLAFAAASKVPPRVFRPENARACIDKTNAVYAKTVIAPADLAAMNDVCSYVFQGDVEKGQACAVKYDCKDTVICDKGLCAERVQKEAGTSCGNAGEVCGAGQYCMQVSAAAYTCVARRTRGTTCDAATPCLETLRCNGTCVDRLATGGGCASDDDCAASAPYCDPYAGNRCDVGLIFAPTAIAACADYGGSARTDGSAATGTGGASGVDAATD